MGPRAHKGTMLPSPEKRRDHCHVASDDSCEPRVNVHLQNHLRGHLQNHCDAFCRNGAHMRSRRRIKHLAPSAMLMQGAAVLPALLACIWLYCYTIAARVGLLLLPNSAVTKVFHVWTLSMGQNQAQKGGDGRPPRQDFHQAHPRID